MSEREPELAASESAKRFNLSKSPIPYFTALITLAASYFLSIRFGLLFTTASQASPVFPATAFGFAILLIFGMRFWPAVALGALVANAVSGVPILAVLMMTIGCTLEATIGAWIYRAIQKRLIVSPLYGNVVSTVASSFVGAVTSATIGALALKIGGLIAWSSFASVWVTWFAGDFTGGIVFTPILLAFAAPRLEPRPRLIAVLKLVGVSALLLWLVLIRPEGAPFVMLVFPYLIFCTIVAGEWGVLIGASAVSLVGSWSTLQRLGAFPNSATNSSLLNLQLLLVGVAITAIMLKDFKKSGQDFLGAAGRVLLCGLAITTCGFFFVFEMGKQKTSSQFASITDDVEPKILDQAKLYFTALNSGAGLYSASQTVTRSEWREFVAQIKPSENLPGLRGLGADYLVAPGKLSAFIESARNDGAKEFTYHAVANGNLSPREHYIITYIEPLETNRQALGLDLATEQARKTASQEARANTHAFLTAKLQRPRSWWPNIHFYQLFIDGAYLFTTVVKGDRLATGDLRKHVRVLARRAEIGRRVYPHLLRHSLATNLLNRGASLMMIKEQLGHVFYYVPSAIMCPPHELESAA